MAVGADGFVVLGVPEPFVIAFVGAYMINDGCPDEPTCRAAPHAMGMGLEVAAAVFLPARSVAPT